MHRSRWWKNFVSALRKSARATLRLSGHAAFEMCYSSLSPGWRNWQTRRTQNPVTARSCRFDSYARHQFWQCGDVSTFHIRTQIPLRNAALFASPARPLTRPEASSAKTRTRRNCHPLAPVAPRIATTSNAFFNSFVVNIDQLARPVENCHSSMRVLEEWTP
jgi:hypothetical protein